MLIKTQNYNFNVFFFHFYNSFLNILFFNLQFKKQSYAKINNFLIFFKKIWDFKFKNFIKYYNLWHTKTNPRFFGVSVSSYSSTYYYLNFSYFFNLNKNNTLLFSTIFFNLVVGFFNYFKNFNLFYFLNFFYYVFINYFYNKNKFFFFLKNYSKNNKILTFNVKFL